MKIKLLFACLSILCQRIISKSNSTILDASIDKVKGENTFFNKWNNLEELQTFYDSLARRSPDILKKQEIGKTVNGNKIFGYRLNYDKDDNVVPKPKIYIQGLAHAREWITGSAVAYIIASFVEAAKVVKENAKIEMGNSTTIPTEDVSDHMRRIIELIPKIEIVAVPIVNPDGYAFSWTPKHRRWRKNRNGSGVDLNRNYDVHYNQETNKEKLQRLKDKNSDIFSGNSAFSEAETKAIRDFITSIAQNTKEEKNSFILGIDFHSYGSKVLRPYGFQSADKGTPSDEKKLKILGDKAAEAMTKIHDHKYESEHAAENIRFEGTGGADDWLIEKAGMDSFTIELRGTSFELPTESIKLAVDEALEGLLTMAKLALSIQSVGMNRNMYHTSSDK